MSEVAYNPGLTSAGANAHTDWTGGGGIINSLGVMLGGLNSDPGNPGSGKPGSSTTAPDITGGVGPPSSWKGIFWAIVIVVGVLTLGKKVI
jgi:hypothetical protein